MQFVFFILIILSLVVSGAYLAKWLMWKIENFLID